MVSTLNSGGHLRQFGLLNQDGEDRTLTYQSLYIKLNDKARFRDLNRLREMELLFLDDKNRLWPGFARPKNIKGGGRKGS